MAFTRHSTSQKDQPDRVKLTPAQAFAILGLPTSADALKVKSTYRRLAFVHHPDRNPECAKSLARFQQVSRAFQTLEAKFRIDAEARPPEVLSGECQACGAYALLREGLDGNWACFDCLVSAEGRLLGLPGPIAVMATCGFAIVTLVVAATCLGMGLALDNASYGVAALILSVLAIASLVWTCLTAVYRAPPTGGHRRR
jgi:hypothetical protein